MVGYPTLYAEIRYPSSGAPLAEGMGEKKAFRAPETPDLQKKRYVLDMFPYPSSAGLHVGHPEGYTATDILSPVFTPAWL